MSDENRSPFDRHLTAALLRQRGRNDALAAEVQERLSPEGKERLFRILQDMEQEAQSKTKYRFFP